MSDILSGLNPAQNDAVTAPDGPVLVVAGAGTGKTRVLTTRIAWLIQEQGLAPENLLAFTFTNRAAREMRQRVARGVVQGQAPGWIGTFHATGVKILRRDGEPLGIGRDFTIFDSDDTLRLVKKLLNDRKLDPKQTPPRQVRSLISRWKSEDTSAEVAAQASRGYLEEVAARVFQDYQVSLQAQNGLDFDDLILKTVHLLEQHDEVRERYARRFRHVLVDEFQDTSPLQLVLVKALCSGLGNLFVVGDDDQSIYSWRGASLANMLEFEQYFPGTRLFRLEQNYRSSGNILSAANAVIANNRQRKGKNLWTTAGDGDLLRVAELADADQEGAELVEIIRRELAAGRRLRDLTVLYRTNAQSRLLEDALVRAGIQYQVVGSLQFYERREVRDLLAYLKFVANPRDLVSALRILNVPKRKIGKATTDRLVQLADQHGLSLGEAAAEPHLLENLLAPAACRRVRDFFDRAAAWRAAEPETTVAALLERIIREVEFEAHLDGDDPTTAADRQQNVAELVNAAHGFDEASGGGRLAQFLEFVALVADADALDEAQGLVRLMTIHTAKGLEFPVVVLSGCEEDLLPHISSQAEQSSLEEERRLFYVSLTRAHERVYLLYARRRRRFGVWEDCLPSRFLNEIPEEVLEKSSEVATVVPPLARRLMAAKAMATPPGAGTGGIGLGSAPGPAVWQDEVNQEEIQFFAGQTVYHASFGCGVVSRVEGQGPTLLVTVEFGEGGRKQVMPHFAPLRPLE